MAVSLGWFGSDFVDSVGDALSSGWDAAVDAVPGARAVVDAADAVLVGPVRDFAHTAVGRTLLTALASSVTGGLAPILGPQLATVAFAIPGMAAGDDFVTAWTQEFGSRVNQTVQILGGDAVPPEWLGQLSKAKDYLASTGVDLSAIDWHALAQQAGIRDDVAAWLVAGATGALDDYTKHFFDPKTGRDLGIGETTADVARRIRDAEIRAALLAYVRSIAHGQQVRGASIAMGLRARGISPYGSPASTGPTAADAAAHAADVRALAPPAAAGLSPVATVAVVGGVAGLALLAWIALR